MTPPRDDDGHEVDGVMIAAFLGLAVWAGVLLWGMA